MRTISFTKFFEATLLAFALTIACHVTANAQALQVDITRATLKPYRIAVPQFSTDSPEVQIIAENIAQVMTSDLVSTGLFKLVDPFAYPQQSIDINIRPNFENWRTINVETLIQAEVKITTDDKIQIQTRLWDALTEKQLTGHSFASQQSNWRRIAHILADAVYQRMTGESGYFDTRIAYIAESGAKDNRTKKLAIMDYDGANHRYLTDGTYLVLTPRFSPNVQKIAYLNYIDGDPRIFIFDLQSGQNQELGNFKNMSFAPRFSYDGKKLIMSFEENGNSDIYEMQLDSRKLTRLTHNSAIDTSPSYSPDGKYITFSSDRSGSQQLYVMNNDGSNTKRISFGVGHGNYGTPVWSPRGDLIAFTKQANRKFYIGVMYTDGAGERTIAEGYLVEGPSWSPNGRVLMFFRQAQKDSEFEIYSIDLTGNNLRKILTPGEASDPTWSPLNP